MHDIIHAYKWGTSKIQALLGFLNHSIPQLPIVVKLLYVQQFIYSSQFSVLKVFKYISGHYIEVQTQQPKLRKTVNVYKPLNDGKWHHVSMETLMRQVRIQVDGESYLYDVGTERGPDNTAGLLYVAGYPK